MTTSSEPSWPRIRLAAIPDDALLVARGYADADDADVALRQAVLFRRRYPDWGRFGLSAFYARSMDELLDLGADPLERFAALAVFGLVALIDAGFEVVPTFRTPHVTIAFVEEPALAYRRLMDLDHQRVVNPGHREERR